MALIICTLVFLSSFHHQGASAHFGPVGKSSETSDSSVHSPASTHWDPKAHPYPPARRDLNLDENFKSKIHGTVRVPDPYRWLEQAPEKSGEVQQFVSHQQNFTKAYISTYPHRNEINATLTKNWNNPQFYTPSLKRDGYYYFYYNPGLLPQDILYRVKKEEADQAMKNAGPNQPGGQLFLDPNIFSSDGTASLTFTEFSYDAKYVAYGISQGGSDLQTIHVRRTDSPHLKTAQDGAKRGEDPGRMSDVIDRVRLSDVSWLKDDSGFFYAKYETDNVGGATNNAGSGENIQAAINDVLYFHKLGDPTSKDIVIMKDPNHPTYRWIHEVSDDGKYLVLKIWDGDSITNQLWFADLTIQKLSGNMKWEKVAQDFSVECRYFAKDGTFLYLLTTKDAPNRKIVTYDLSKPAQGFHDLVPEDPQAVLITFLPVNNHFAVLSYSKDVSNQLYLYDLKTGAQIERVDQDMTGTLDDLTGLREDNEFLFGIESFVNPGISYRYRFARPAGQELTVFRSIQIDGWNPNDFVTKQIFYKSKDGTQVPMFIVHLKNFQQNGTAPALQYGYGAFGSSIRPLFSLTLMMFVARFGGVLAVPNIRGGGELGETWHLAGSGEKKQNSFDDFQYATKHLVANKYVAPTKVTIQGSSAGGLLVAACVNQAPELYGAAIADVAVLDMLRFPLFSVGNGWVTEFGDPNQPDAFDYLFPYSPLQNINPKASYPALMLSTADRDDRVAPLHSFKYAAAVQNAIPNNAQPLLLRVTQNAGHMGGNTQQIIDLWVDYMSFLALSLGLVWNSKGVF